MGYPQNHIDTLPCLAPGEQEAQRRALVRAWDMLMLARSPEGWAALLRGEDLPHDQVDRNNLRRARRRRV